MRPYTQCKGRLAMRPYTQCKGRLAIRPLKTEACCSWMVCRILSSVFVDWQIPGTPGLLQAGGDATFFWGGSMALNGPVGRGQALNR